MIIFAAYSSNRQRANAEVFVYIWASVSLHVSNRRLSVRSIEFFDVVSSSSSSETSPAETAAAAAWLAGWLADRHWRCRNVGTRPILRRGRWIINCPPSPQRHLCRGRQVHSLFLQWRWFSVASMKCAVNWLAYIFINIQYKQRHYYFIWIYCSFTYVNATKTVWMEDGLFLVPLPTYWLAGWWCPSACLPAYQSC